MRKGFSLGVSLRLRADKLVDIGRSNNPKYGKTWSHLFSIRVSVFLVPLAISFLLFPEISLLVSPHPSPR